MTKLDAAAYVSDMADQLRIIAISHRLNVEAYLLEMVAMSARGSASESQMAREATESEFASSDIMALVIHDEVQAAG